MSLYLDANVIVPTLVEEAGSAAAARFLSGTTEKLIVSDFTDLAVTMARS